MSYYAAICQTQENCYEKTHSDYRILYKGEKLPESQPKVLTVHVSVTYNVVRKSSSALINPTSYVYKPCGMVPHFFNTTPPQKQKPVV